MYFEVASHYQNSWKHTIAFMFHSLPYTYALFWIPFECSLLPSEHSEDNPKHVKHAANTSIWRCGQIPLQCVNEAEVLLKKEQSPKSTFYSTQSCPNKDEISSPYIIYQPQQCLFELYLTREVFCFNEHQIHARILTENHLIESYVF